MSERTEILNNPEEFEGKAKLITISTLDDLNHITLSVEYNAEGLRSGLHEALELLLRDGAEILISENEQGLAVEVKVCHKRITKDNPFYWIPPFRSEDLDKFMTLSEILELLDEADRLSTQMSQLGLRHEQHGDWQDVKRMKVKVTDRHGATFFFEQKNQLQNFVMSEELEQELNSHNADFHQAGIKIFPYSNEGIQFQLKEHDPTLTWSLNDENVKKLIAIAKALIGAEQSKDAADENTESQKETILVIDGCVCLGGYPPDASSEIRRSEMYQEIAGKVVTVVNHRWTSKGMRKRLRKKYGCTVIFKKEFELSRLKSGDVFYLTYRNHHTAFKTEII